MAGAVSAPVGLAALVGPQVMALMEMPLKPTMVGRVAQEQPRRVGVGAVVRLRLVRVVMVASTQLTPRQVEPGLMPLLIVALVGVVALRVEQLAALVVRVALVVA